MSSLRATLTSKNVLVFIILNEADIVLTTVALALGSSELNFIYSTFRSPALMACIKVLMVGVIILALQSMRRTNLFSWLNIGMLAVVGWNALAVLSWSLS